MDFSSAYPGGWQVVSVGSDTQPTYVPARYGGIGNPNDYVSGYPTSRPSAWQDGPQAGAPWRVGAILVTAEERNAMNVQVLQFRTDVDAAEAVESADRAANIAHAAGAVACRAAGLAWDCATQQCVQTPDPDGHTYSCIEGVSFALRDFRTNRLTPFLADWDANLTNGSAIGVANFELLKAQFASLVSEWKGMGQSTSAVPPPVRPPGDALETVAAWAPWLLGGAALLIAGVYILPVVAPLVAGALARK